MNITEEQIEAAKQKQLQDAASLASMMDDPAEPENTCISCE